MLVLFLNVFLLLNTNIQQDFPTIVCTFAYTESRFKNENVMQISPILFKHKMTIKYKKLKPLYDYFGYKLVDNNRIVSYILGMLHIKGLIQRYRNIDIVIDKWSKGVYSRETNPYYREKFNFFYKNVCKNNTQSMRIITEHLINNNIPNYNY